MCFRAADVNVQAAWTAKGASKILRAIVCIRCDGWSPFPESAHVRGQKGRASRVRLVLRTPSGARRYKALTRVTVVSKRYPSTAVPDEGKPVSEDSPGDWRNVALDALYREHHPGLVRFIRRRSPGERVFDLVQQVFVRLARMSEKERAEIAVPQAYLRQVATNLMRDDVRRDERRSLRNHVDADDVVLVACDQTAALEARDKLRRLDSALARLSPRTREIFLAHRLDGYSYAEIARRTGLSIKTIEVHMTRAIAHLDRYRDA